jgi:hypothetical protein
MTKTQIPLPLFRSTLLPTSHFHLLSFPVPCPPTLPLRLPLCLFPYRPLSAPPSSTSPSPTLPLDSAPFSSLYSSLPLSLSPHSTPLSPSLVASPPPSPLPRPLCPSRHLPLFLPLPLPSHKKSAMTVSAITKADGIG